MLVEKLKQLFIDLEKTRAEVSPLQLTAQAMEIGAIVEREGDLPPEAFAVFPKEIRAAAGQIALGVLIQAIR